MNASSLTSRRGFLRLTVAGAIGTAVAACTAISPTPTAVPPMPTAAPPTTATTVPLPAATPTVAPTPTIAPQPTVTPIPQPAATVAPVPSAPTKVVFWWSWPTDTHSYAVNSINTVVARFNENHSNIKVETAQVGWNSPGMLAGALLGGAQLDLFEQGPPASLATGGALVPLDEYLGSSREISKSTFLDVSLKEGSWNGKLYGLPSLEHFTLLSTVVNENLYTSKGLKVPDDVPKTFEEAFAQGKKYTTFDSLGDIDLLWFAYGQGRWEWLGLPYGVVAYDEDNQKFKFDDPGWKDVLQQMADLYMDPLGFAKIDKWYGTHMYPTMLPGCATCTDKLAVFDFGYWGAGELSRSAPGGKFAHSWHLVPNSRKGKKVQEIGIHYVSIPSVSKNREQAWQLAEHLVSNESVKTLFEGCGFLLGTKALIEKPESVIDPKTYRGIDWHIGSVKQADELRGFPACPIQDFVSSAWQDTFFGVGKKSTTVDQALIDLQRACTQELDKALKV